MPFIQLVDSSDLRFISASSALIPIDWTRIPEETKKFYIKQYGYESYDLENQLPATIGGLVNVFDETKFFGYFSSDIVKLLMDISEFGLKSTPPNGPERLVGPRFYMSYSGQLWFLLFAPGTRDCIMGQSEYIIRNTNDDEDDDNEAWAEMAADDTAMARAFDVKLEQEILLGKGEMVEFNKELAGWAALTLPSQLEVLERLQLEASALTLPSQLERLQLEAS